MKYLQLFLFFIPAFLFAESFEVASIKIEGLQRTDEAAVLARLDFLVGDVIDYELLRQNQEELSQLSALTFVEITTQPSLQPSPQRSETDPPLYDVMVLAVDGWSLLPTMPSVIVEDERGLKLNLGVNESNLFGQL